MRLRARAVGLFATLLLLVIVIGLPLALHALAGNPVPTSVPTLDQLRSALTTPDDGTLALGAITLIAWVAWAVLAVSILLEIGSRLRGAPAVRLPGLNLPQLAARQLVAAAALLFVVVPASPALTPATAATSAAPATFTSSVTATPARQPTTAPATLPAATTETASTQTTQATRRTYTVRPGDSLSRIASTQLGHAGRWPEIAALNPSVAGDPDLIHAGTVLHLPAGAPGEPGRSAARTYTVRAGDTLSAIARDQLGDARQYPAIFTASRDTVQPGGVHLSDPDRIDIGQRLTIPPTFVPPTSPAVLPTSPAVLLTSPVVVPPASPTPPVSVPTLTGKSGEPARPSSSAPAAPAGPRPVDRPNRPDPSGPGSSAADATTATSPAASPASPVPAGAAHSSAATEETDHLGHASWMLTGLTGAGAVLAGSLLMLLRRRRRAQSRGRRPGRTLAAPDAVLNPVEKTITSVGRVTAPTIEHLDAVLRRLAAAAARDEAVMPPLTAVELTVAHIVLHLADPTQLPGPWQGTPDGYHWKVAPDVPLDQLGPEVPDQPAPYPLLVTIGVNDTEDVWLLNIEDLCVTITGDPIFGLDFVRYLAAEVACNPWSAGVTVDCVGVATELAALNPDRIHAHHTPGTPDMNHRHDMPDTADAADPPVDPIGTCLTDTVHAIDRTSHAGRDIVTARAAQDGADAWPARLLIIDAATDHPALDQLLDQVHAHPGQTGTSVVVRGQGPRAPGTIHTLLEVTADGRVTLAEAGLNLVAVGLTSDEAQGCAALLAHTDTVVEVPVPVDEVPVPVDGDAVDGWRAWSNQAGALREHHTQPRAPADAPDERPEPDQEGQVPPAPKPGSSLLEQDDATYLAVAATTTQDLQVLAPRVRPTVRAGVEAADPTLDDDVAMWFHDNSALPKLRLLGPVRATTRGTPLTKRKPYMTELLTFIALRRHGATPEEVSQAFNTISRAKVRDYVLTIRQWLGTNPRTGQPHLPDARTAPAAEIRGVPVYQVLDLLIDIDLFRRLRVRGEARGADGIPDLRTALRLVEGRPFDYPVEREAGGGWAWLVEGDRVDEHMAVAIVDVAHLVTTHALAAGDLTTARLAAETATLAAPHEEIPRLDLAAVATAEGHHAEAQRIIRDEVCNRTDDDEAPPELSTRTQQILTQRQDWLGTKVS
ncbi:LysM peptidoglycan-binding domain-containing protein [Lapillicoccus sp.]|uniref:LysM peptidoglycan-binding domain-containing protein n=1 Tax=Lapillicoccus sp. TaxID=1909287 RepID=UPI0025E03164|nr:LysM peptidoglycan-binding domain-containing protein [Lapillicoccus sp.]